jgi:hypothetical protein
VFTHHAVVLCESGFVISFLTHEGVSRVRHSAAD